jgi:HAD superfamily hydrolase (TIGR01549 family)
MAGSLAEYLKQNPKKHLIFDFDGTIFSLDWDHGEEKDAFRARIWEMFRQISPDLLEEYPEPTKGVFEQIANKAVGQYGEKAKEIIFPFFEAKERTLIETAKPFAETVRFIQEYNQNYTFHIWSSNIDTTFKTILAQNKLLQHFNTLVGRNQVDLAKPYSEGFDLIYDGKSPKSDYLMIGDAERDLKAAENAGIDFFFV